MIFNKDASFPYPVLTNFSDAYQDLEFSFDLDLMDDTDDYIFSIEYTLESNYLLQLLEEKKAEMIFILQSKDNKFYKIESNHATIRIPKNRLSLSSRTVTQLMIKAKDTITFSDNHDLNTFYANVKEDIIVEKNSVLAISNIVVYDGSSKNPFELFEKRLDKNLVSEIKLETSDDMIIIHYRDEAYQFAESSESTNLNYPYVYMGLQKALMQMIFRYGEGQEYLEFAEMDVQMDNLSMKLYNLMKSKSIETIYLANLDEVIYKISDKVIDKYSKSVRRLIENGN